MLAVNLNGSIVNGVGDMNNDLISRSAILERETYMFDEALGWTACILTEDIKDTPAVDAVPVVRCKECEHKHAISCEGIVLCTYHGKMIQMKSSDFCSYGERKSE